MCLEDVYKVFFQILNCKADRQTDRQKNHLTSCTYNVWGNNSRRVRPKGLGQNILMLLKLKIMIVKSSLKESIGDTICNFKHFKLFLSKPWQPVLPV